MSVFPGKCLIDHEISATSVAGDDLAGDKASIIGGKKEGESCDVLRFAQAAQNAGPPFLVKELVGSLLAPLQILRRGYDYPRGDTVDIDSVGS